MANSDAGNTASILAGDATERDTINDCRPGLPEASPGDHNHTRDASWFAELLDEHVDQAFERASTLTGDPSAAEGLAAEAVTAAWRARNVRTEQLPRLRLLLSLLSDAAVGSAHPEGQLARGANLDFLDVDLVERLDSGDASAIQVAREFYRAQGYRAACAMSLLKTGDAAQDEQGLLDAFSGLWTSPLSLPMQVSALTRIVATTIRVLVEVAQGANAAASEGRIGADQR